jgi:hypothetical protein
MDIISYVHKSVELLFQLLVETGNEEEAELTINVPLIWKVREIIFLAGKTHNGTVRGIFRGPLEKSRELSHYEFCPRK